MMNNFALLILTVFSMHFVFFSYTCMMLIFTNRINLLDVGFFLVNIDSDLFKAVGISQCIALSILGAAIGIYCVGSSLLGVGIKKQHVKTKNLVSIIFCEAGAIYGLVIGVVMISSVHPSVESSEKDGKTGINKMNCYAGHLVFGSGLIVGFVNLFSGISVGILGSGVVLADAGNPQTFVKNIILEIFAGALGLFGLIIGVYLLSKVPE